MPKQVFISYSTRDQQKVRKVKQHLEEAGIPCWMADESIKSGEQFKTVIVKAIKQCDVFLFFSSADANTSPWTIKEINTAVHLGKPIVPVRLDNTPYNDSILFDIGCLDYVDLSGITKMKPGLDKLVQTLQGVLNMAPAERKTKRSVWKPVLWTLLALLVIAAAIVCIPRFIKPSVEKTTLPNGDIVFTIDTVHLKMIQIKGGTFMMGSNTRDDDQQPAHQVQLYDYYLSETEITQELWETVMGNNPSKNRNMQNLPVDNVSWEDCRQFIEQLNLLTGESFRMPTEAQWEYAARGGEHGQDTLYAGSNDISEVTLYHPEEKRYVLPVRTAGKPNYLGLYDMTGNVFEWCSDGYCLYPKGLIINPHGDDESKRRIMRGGSWYNSELRTLTVTFRGTREEGGLPRQDIGLRLAIDEN
ncbi:MAG: SUMF1/EgtB/PvdO family nonheme iron enzyme [Paludibacteraceae bacterium]|nr:SUMF1/EgtB/PvdO family nonheme iron enzyme [Paludibacteraceae bacterium]